MEEASENNNLELEANFIALIKNQLQYQEQQEVEKIISADNEAEADFEFTKEIWEKLGNVSTPSPSPEMKTRFYTMLDTFKEQADIQKPIQKDHFLQKVKNFFSYKPALNWAYALMLVIVGGLGGYFLKNGNSQAVAGNETVEALSKEVQEMKQMMMLAMLENPVATERLKAVSYTQELKTVDNKIIDALFTTLNSDPNENVRLVTLEALMQLADNPKVREGLVQSLMKQESPLVQVELADAMVKLQEKRSVKQFRKMLEKDDLNKAVKVKIENSIKELS
jgi:uncharacterized membrane protein (UPF0136 family)